MSSFGPLLIAGAEFREELTVQGIAGGIKVSGQTAHPPRLRAEVASAAHNVRALRGMSGVPVVFSEQTAFTGFYDVSDASVEAADSWNDGKYQTATWSVSLVLNGTSHDVEIESRVPSIPRPTEVAGAPTAVIWHAPAAGAGAYYTGPTVPAGSVVRTSSDGPVTVYTGIPSTPAPHWTSSAENYLDGSARILFDGYQRLGLLTPPLAVWEVNNGLVRIQAGVSGAFVVSAWDTDPLVDAYASPKEYAVTVNGVTLTGTPEFSVIRNEAEQVIVRLTYTLTGPGRVSVDLGLRRGSRTVTGVLKRHSAATLGITRTAAEAATAVTGGLRATSVDADGNRFVMGSSRNLTTTTATASIAKASVTALDFFLGHEYGASPAAGDAFVDLFAQYLGSTGEFARLVRR